MSNTSFKCWAFNNKEKMSENQKIHDIRKDYTKDSLDINNSPQDPFELFKKWFDEALLENFYDPTAMTLATADHTGRPSARVVLLKEYDNNGFVFFTNYESRKGGDLLENPYASILFYWDKMERQIRIEGKVMKITAEESYNYYKTRPRLSRLGAHASKQSQPLKSRFTLMKEVAKLAIKFPFEIPLPEFWGGYRLKPENFEFWQGRKNRLHDRIQFLLNNEKWEKNRLSP